MAAELSYRHTATGSTMKATIRQPLTTGGKIRMCVVADGSFEDLTVANWANYIITMTETPASSYGYVGTWPAGLSTVGWYAVDFYDGATIAGTLAGTFLGYWDGTNFNLGGADARQIAGTATAVPGASGGLLISGSNAGTTTFGALTVTGAVAFSSTFGVTGAVTLSSSLTTGAVVINNGAGAGLSITGTTIGVDINASAGIGIDVDGTTGGLDVSASEGHGISSTSTGGLSSGLYLLGNGTGPGLDVEGGTTAPGISVVGGATSGSGMKIEAAGTNDVGLEIIGIGTGAGMSVTGGATGHGLYCYGGATSGDGIYAAGQTAGDGMTLVGAGASQYDLNADIKGDITGEVATLGGLAAASAAKLDDILDGTGGTGLTISAITLTTPIESDLVSIHGTALTETAGLLAGGFKKFFNVASPTGTVNSLPDAVPDEAGGLPISDDGGLDMDALVAGSATNITISSTSFSVD